MASKKKINKLDNPTPAPGPELGVSNIRAASGYIYDEYQRELVGLRGRKKYREMKDSDPTIGGILFAITSIVRNAKWDVDAAEADTEEKYAEWFEDTLFKMPGMSWDDVVCDALSMVAFGFSIQEIVIRRKEDGTIGLYKLAPRAQDTVLRFDLDPNGNVLGVWQTPPNMAGDIYIPKEKLVHYVTDYNRGNPEGRSLLRNAYKPYHFINTIQIQEAIGVERDLSGMPILKAPAAWLEQSSNRAALERIVRDIKFNDQGGLVLPSDAFLNADGSKTSIPQFELILASAESGGSKIDTDKIIARHTRQMASSILAQFITLGGDGKGSYALSENQSDLFLKAIESLLEIIKQVLERQLLPLLWRLNGFPEEMKPCLRAGKIAPEDLAAFAAFIRDIAGAGIMLNDRDTEEYIREKGGLPPPPDESLLDEVTTPPDDPEDAGEKDEEAEKGLLSALKKFMRRG